MDPFHQIAITGITTSEEAGTGVSGFRLLRGSATGSEVCRDVKKTLMDDHISSHLRKYCNVM